MNWPFQKKNPGRELARIGAEQRHSKIVTVAKQIRRELALPEDPRLQA